MRGCSFVLVAPSHRATSYAKPKGFAWSPEDGHSLRPNGSSADTPRLPQMSVLVSLCIWFKGLGLVFCAHLAYFLICFQAQFYITHCRKMVHQENLVWNRLIRGYRESILQELVSLSVERLKTQGSLSVANKRFIKKYYIWKLCTMSGNGEKWLLQKFVNLGTAFKTLLRCF